MKKIAIFLFFTSILLGACKKHEYDIKPSGNHDNDHGYAWTGINPLPVENLGKVQVSSNVFDYAFKIYLGGSQINPAPFDLGSFAIPRVPKGGGIVYNNVPGEATYTINKIEGAWLYYTVRSEAGHSLKYNIAKRGPTGWVWFLRYGLSHDDGINNIETFYTY